MWAFRSSRTSDAHLNNACSRAVSPRGGTGTFDNLSGDQLAIWNQVNRDTNSVIPSTHLTIFVPPALGAFILSNLKPSNAEPPQLKNAQGPQNSSNLVLTASQPFHLSLPTVFPENEELTMKTARQAAAHCFIRSEAIPLLAITDESFYHRKLQWTLRFPMPRPAAHSGELRFSSATTLRQGPHSAEAMEGALRLAAPFSYAQDATHILYNSPFLRLPHISAIIDPPRLPPLDPPHPPEPCIQEWLNNGARDSYHPVCVPGLRQSLKLLWIISTVTFTSHK